MYFFFDNNFVHVWSMNLFTHKIKFLFGVLNLYENINIYDISDSLMLVNKLEFDSNLGKLGSSNFH